MADIQVLLTGGIDDGVATALMTRVAERVNTGSRSLLLAISSPGGYIHSGITMYGFLRGLGIEVITHNIGQVDSSAGVIYCAGSLRRSAPSARFLVHGVSWTFAQESLPERRLNEIVAELAGQRDALARILAERSGAELSRVEQDMLAQTILSAEQALAYGLAHEIAEDVFDPSQEIVRVP